MFRIKVNVFVSFCLVASILFVGGLAKPAFADKYESTGTLTDGVDDNDPLRSTTINSKIWAVEQVGDLMLVGGSFTTVRDRSSYKKIPRPYLAAFDPSTGEYVPWFNVQTDGSVFDIKDLGNGKAIIAGEFDSVNSVPGTKGLAIIDVETGVVDTGLNIELNGSGVIRALDIVDGNIYVGGSFNYISVNGVSLSSSGAAIIDLDTFTLDSSFNPTLEGGGVWGIAATENGRVFIGGYFASVNGQDDTEVLSALNPDGSLVVGWNHGFNHRTCTLTWSDNCGAINGMAIADGKLFTAGAKHYWTAQSVDTGEVLANKQISNDGQTVDLVDGMIVIGCHCTAGNSDEFFGVKNRYLRVIDPVTMTEVESPTVNSIGGAGGWAAGQAADGCLWGGGEFTTTTVNGGTMPVWDLLRFCPDGVGNSVSQVSSRISNDTSAPQTPDAPSVTSQNGSTINLNWSSVSDDSGQVVYAIFRNGVFTARTSGSSFSDIFLDPGIHYWQVAAFDMSGNMSDISGRSVPVEIAEPLNIAAQGTVAQSGDAAPNQGAEKAIDGNTAGDYASGSISKTSNGAWWGIDLGQQTNVDFVKIYPSTEDFRESNNRVRVYSDEDEIFATHRTETTGLKVWTARVARNEPRVEHVTISNEVRYIRIIGSYSFLPVAEVEVYTTPILPTPSLPVADSSKPSAPSWKKVVNGENTAVLSWGGAGDNVGVAYYEIYLDNQILGRTTENSISVPGAGKLGREFNVVAFDAMNNSSNPIVILDLQSCTAVRNGTDISIDWVSGSDPDKFIVRRSVNGSANYWRAALSGDKRSFIDSERSGEIEYSVEYKKDDSITSVDCEMSLETLDEPPTGLRQTYSGRDRVVLSWDSTGGQQIEIERDGSIIGTDSDRWYTDRNLSSGTTYQYRLRFVGSNTWSAPISASTQN